jgi:hypothetical protein
MANKVYWTTAKGQKIDIDSMDVDHLRNILKVIIKANNNLTRRSSSQINGELAQDDQDKIDFYKALKFDFKNQSEEDDFLEGEDLFSI